MAWSRIISMEGYISNQLTRFSIEIDLKEVQSNKKMKKANNLTNLKPLFDPKEFMQEHR